jgi:hypothetical protein
MLDTVVPLRIKAFCSSGFSRLKYPGPIRNEGPALVAGDAQLISSSGRKISVLWIASQMTIILSHLERLYKSTGLQVQPTAILIIRLITITIISKSESYVSST